MRFINYEIFAPLVALRVLAECSLRFEQCARATRFVFFSYSCYCRRCCCTHSRYSCYSCWRRLLFLLLPFFFFYRVTRLLILLFLPLLLHTAARNHGKAAATVAAGTRLLFLLLPIVFVARVKRLLILLLLVMTLLWRKVAFLAATPSLFVSVALMMLSHPGLFFVYQHALYQVLKLRCACKGLAINSFSSSI